MNESDKKKKYKINKMIDDENQSKLKKYQDLILGETGFWKFLKFEIIMTCFSWVPGAIGIFLRGKLFPLILGSVGKGVIFGTNIVLRHPHKIRIGENTVIDDNCLIDAKGTSNAGIEMGKNVFIGRNTILSCKDGDIILKDFVNIGFNCEIFSSCKVILEDYALLAAYCYVVGGGEYDLAKKGKPIALQPIFEEKEVVIEKNCWLGARVTVFSGIKIGHDSAIGSGALVNSEIPPFSIAVGMPAKVIKKRE